MDSLKLERIDLDDWPFSVRGIAYGQARRLPLEVLVSEHGRTPSATQLRSAWKKRQAGRGVPLLVIVLHAERAWVCGPAGEDPPVYENLDPGQVERICQEALEQQSRTKTLRALRDSLGAVGDQQLPGLQNQGFLASHELEKGVPERPDWQRAGERSRNILRHTGRELLTALGFTTERLDAVTDVLKIDGRRNAVAILLEDHEEPEGGSERIPGSLSPVSYALARADEENLDWVVLLHGRKIRLYPVRMGVGVGRRGRTETFLECHTGLIPDDRAAYLWLLFSRDALQTGGSIGQILTDSQDFAGALATRLRERIYDEVIPRFAEGLAEARGIDEPDADDLALTYQMAMRLLFRLLFIAYGEDKDLLPYDFNGLYQKRSLKTKAKELLQLHEAGTAFGDEDDWWQEVHQIFRAVENGNAAWGVPAYGGGLFSSDPDESRIGAALEEVSLPDRVFGPALQHLLLVPTPDGALGPVDFRSLGVREFGTIYEGLLESELSIAETDLTVEQRGKNKDAYRPCKEGEPVVVPVGEVYLHNASGARKSTGSYYTKSFAVEHLLDRALEPALDDHFARLDELDELEAAEAFFDFRVADIAMGSAHFLVAAIDRIEARFSGYLAKRTLPHVKRELDHLRQAAMEALGDAAESYPDFEDNALLRRQIARRCIYGVDLNEVAVQLARLAIWIHTFVPGLPLSLLDRNLVHGNSLVGVGLLSEITDKVREEGYPLFEATAEDFVGDAAEALQRMGRLADATRAEVKQARKVWEEADAATAPARALCDILTASRIKGEPLPFDFTRWREESRRIFGSEEHRMALNDLKGMDVLHFPMAFPEVFLRERSGFDVILGNPPWEKVRVEAHGFWARHMPGLRGLSQRERERLIGELETSRPDLKEELEREAYTTRVLRKVLATGPYPGMGTGDPDLYKAFCWRFWNLINIQQGTLGVVLPRSVLSAKGSEDFRFAILEDADSIEATTLVNTARWAFDMEPRYTVVLLTVSKSQEADKKLYLKGPFSNLPEFIAGVSEEPAEFDSTSVETWNDSVSMPLLPTDASVSVFAQLRESPRLDTNDGVTWRVRPIAEVHATNDKHMYDLESLECPAGFWPVYKGASFDLWEPETGEHYAWADPDIVRPVLQEKRLRGSRSAISAFSECPRDWCTDVSTLPCNKPRIAFRDVTNRTNKRTLVSALVPPGVFLNHTAPYLLFSRGNAGDEAYLLGILSSLPMDWYARRFVETHVTFFVLNPFPVPRPEPDSHFRKRVIELSGRLAAVDDRFQEWATSIGVNFGPLEVELKQDMIHELDAVVAHLYGLDAVQLTHIFETFHEGWDYETRLAATLKHFEDWSDAR